MYSQPHSIKRILNVTYYKETTKMKTCLANTYIRRKFPSPQPLCCHYHTTAALIPLKNDSNTHPNVVHPNTISARSIHPNNSQYLPNTTHYTHYYFVCDMIYISMCILYLFILKVQFIRAHIMNCVKNVPYSIHRQYTSTEHHTVNGTSYSTKPSCFLKIIFVEKMLFVYAIRIRNNGILSFGVYAVYLSTHML